MKNKGFTLIELLGVIVILALLMVLVMPKIINSLKSSSEKVDDLTLKMIYNAAELYVDEYKDEFKTVNGNKYCITLTDLTEEEYLKAPINVNDTDITSLKTVQATYNDGFEYELKNNDECKEKEILEPGLYDKDDNLIALWSELNIDVENNSSIRLNEAGVKLVIPGTIKTIGENAFYGNETLETVIILDGVETISYRAFFLCTNLSSIIFPNTLKVIEDEVFYDTALTSIEIPEGVTSIGHTTFAAIEELSEVKLPSTLESIGDIAFFECHSLTSIEIPEGVTSIGEWTFYNCYNLKTIYYKGTAPGAPWEATNATVISDY